MKFLSPKLEIDEQATDRIIEESVSALKPEADSFAILSESDMIYVQALATEHGFVVQFQTGSIDRHYEFEDYLSSLQTISLFKAYLSQVQNWQGNLQFNRVNLRGFWGSLGFLVGRLFGGIISGSK